MINLAPLRPRDGSPSAIADAMRRTETSGRGIAAEMTQLRAKRAGLLVVGTPEAVAIADAELKRVAADGELVMDLHAELQRMFAAATAPAPKLPEENARLHALKTAAEFATWWAGNAASVTRGLQLLGHMTEAAAAWHVVAGQQQPAQQPTNVVNLAPPTGGA